MDITRNLAKYKAAIPTESQEQAAFVSWFRLAYPALTDLFFAIPNGAHKSPAMAAKFKREGLVSGVPDICLAHPKHGLHGLFIEMKRIKGGKVSDSQQKILASLAAQGYSVRVCFGCDEAIEAVRDYLR